MAGSPATRPVWAEISRGALLGNYSRLRDRAASLGAEIVCVIKADAYGHGAAECMRVLSSAGAAWFAVTCVEEALKLRRAGVYRAGAAQRMLVLSGVYAGEADAAIEHRLTPVLSSPEQAEWLAAARNRSNGDDDSYNIHVEIDTGMARQGVRWNDANAIDAFKAQLTPGLPLRLEGLMTHLASPDDPESSQNAQQLERFAQAVQRWAAVGLVPAVIHGGNSATIFEAAQTRPLVELAKRYGARLLLRPGIALYGYGPHARAMDLQPVLAWKTEITALRWLEPGEPVSYNATFRCSRRTRIALLPVGYADGYNRLLSNHGRVLVRGVEAPVVGRVTMDQIMVDVTDVPAAAIGDEVVLLGGQGTQRMSADDLAALLGTISYEVLCDIGARVPRISVA